MDRIAPLAVGGALAFALTLGFLNRDENHLTPEHGLGYWLGTAGAAAMLLLLVYPLRKRLKVLRAFGSVTFWFRIHMALGLIGPTLILFHSNFQLGSVNSNVALFAMLTVASSGIAGRYLYGRSHLGLYGRKAAVKDILADAERLRAIVGHDVPAAERVMAELGAFKDAVMRPHTSFFASLWSLPKLSLRTRIKRAALSAELRRLVVVEAKRQRWSRRERRRRLAAAAELLTLYFAAVQKAAAFSFYERLFALWHVFHLPLFILLVLAAAIHVVAVHFY